MEAKRRDNLLLDSILLLVVRGGSQADATVVAYLFGKPIRVAKDELIGLINDDDFALLAVQLVQTDMVDDTVSLLPEDPPMSEESAVSLH